MKLYKKTLLGSVVAFFVGTSCCWLSSLAIWLGGATVVGMLVHFVEEVQIFSLSLGILLLVIILFFYSKRNKGKRRDY